MLNKKVHIVIFLFIWVVQGVLSQESTLFPTTYFDDKDQNSAVLTAKYGELGYRFSKDVIYSQNDYRNQKNLDTAFYFMNRAIQAIDTTHTWAKDSLTRDSTKIGLLYMRRSKLHFRRSRMYLSYAYKTRRYNASQDYTRYAMYEAGKGISDAYTGSIYFSDRKDSTSTKDSTLTPKDSLALADGLSNATSLECDCEEELERLREELKKKAAANTAVPSNTLGISSTSEPVDDIIPRESLEARLARNDEAREYESNLEQNQNKIDSLKNLLANAQTEEERAAIQKLLDKELAQQNSLDKEYEKTENELEKVRDQLDALMNNGNDKKEPIFAFDKKGFYNENKPIPIDEPVPDGLFYSVQLGVYSRQAIPGWFKGLYPIAGETASNSKYRYRTGIFYTYSQVQKIKNQIRDFGLKDAFVVAYNNGKMISVAEAIRLEKLK